MTKRVLNVGQCSPDHAAISRLLSDHFKCEVDRAEVMDDTLQKLRSGEYDLVLVNRKLDADYSDGIEIIRSIKADPELKQIPCMLITNYAEHQDQAVACGAAPGFGKQQYQDPETFEKLKPFLS